MPRLSISSWSLHKLLGEAWFDADAGGRLRNRSSKAPRLDLLEAPALAARHGITTLEVYHFHLPRTDAAYLDRLRTAVADAGVSLFSLLIDTGDISAADPEVRERDRAMIEGWIDTAAALGAAHVRVIAGDGEPTAAAVERSVDGLRGLAAYAADRGVATLTENFRRLAARPETCLHILDACDGAVGLCADFGNFPLQTRAADLAAVLPRATSIHAKAEYPAGRMDAASYGRLLRQVVDSGFDGPVSLICQDETDALPGIEEMKRVTLEALG